MNTTLRRDADAIVRSSIQAVLPDEAVRRALEDFQPKGGRVLLVAAGKAAWQMAHAAALAAAGWNVFDALQNNDAYHALQAVEGLILTGATGTNVNDVAVALV